ncbi:uncharacterized protein C2845_PM16G04380 [Panicum miliaceum]|uniref:Dirigent protein n=1 Tax=Panicum miliaceum TaxID=4540 RepID=A0A3L6PRW7_PANMI|nr:uncharacterized protein C2845_PM16G04380 [Panicum miliaceum]
MAATPFKALTSAASASTMERDELRISGLYLHHAYRERSPTQLTIVRPPKGMFGKTAANNWTIHEGPDPREYAIVARAQGLHLNSGNWHNSFTIVFENDRPNRFSLTGKQPASRFKGSTLHVMGVSVSDSDWGVVGGTGEFAMAQGVISKKLFKQIETGNIVELNIYAIYPAKIPHLIRDGPVGGNGGNPFEPQYEPRRFESIKVLSGEAVDSIEFSYIDRNGIKRTGVLRKKEDAAATAGAGPTLLLPSRGARTCAAARCREWPL